MSEGCGLRWETSRMTIFLYIYGAYKLLALSFMSFAARIRDLYVLAITCRQSPYT